MLATLYKDMWDNFSRAMEQEKYALDEWIDHPNDTRRGISAIAYLAANNQVLSQEIGHFLQQFEQFEPNQYCHKQDELHLTILAIISCFAGFSLDQIAPQQYIKLFHRACQGVAPIEIEFNGITASPSCILIQGFPKGEGLHQLRENLRSVFKQSGLHTSIDSRYSIVTAHISVVRFCTQLKDPIRLLAFCEQFRQHPFGTVRLTELALVFNNWYQNQSATRLLQRISLA